MRNRNASGVKELSNGKLLTISLLMAGDVANVFKLAVFLLL